MTFLGEFQTLIFFLQRNFTHKKAYKMQTKATSMQIFLYAQKALKSKQATFTHKCHKK